MTKNTTSLRVNARFDAEYRRKLALVGRRLGLNVSDTLKAGIDKLAESLERKPKIRPYEAFRKAGFIGSVSGPGDGSVNYRRYLAEAIVRRHGHR